jgi:hypothetical protein
MAGPLLADPHPAALGRRALPAHLPTHRECPRGKILRPGNPVAHGRFFYARKRDCDRCALASICVSKGRSSKGLVISHDSPALLRARRRRERWSAADQRLYHQRLYQRHRWRSEGFHGEAKTWHGLARAVRRGLQNMRIQASLTASAINLKRLAAALVTLWWALIPTRADHHALAQSRRPMDMMIQGWSMRRFHAEQQ